MIPTNSHEQSEKEKNEDAGLTLFIQPEVETEEPTYLQTLGANVRQFNDVKRGISWLSEKGKNPYLDEYEEGYNPIQAGLLDQVPDEPQFISRVLTGKTLQEGQQIVKSINQELQDANITQRSGFWANTSTILGATLVSPTTLFSVGQTVKYAQIGKGAFQNALYSAKVLGASSALQNAILVGTKETQGVQNWVNDTMLDTFIGGCFGGVLGAFAAKGAQKELNTAKGFFKAIEDEVQIKYKVSEKGEVLGPLAEAAPGSSAGAMRVKNVQDLLDSGTVDFKDNKLIRNTLGFAQPIIDLLTNRFKIANAFGDDFFSHNFEVAGKQAGLIRDPAAENFVRLSRSVYENLNLMTKQHYHDYLGLRGPAKGTQASYGSWTGKWMAEEEFNEHVGRAIRRNGVYEEVPEAGAAAKKWIDEQYDPLWKELKKYRPGLEDHEYTNIARYMNRVYHKGKIQERPDEFVAEIKDFLTASNEKIKARMQPIEALKEQLKGVQTKVKLEEELENLKRQVRERVEAGEIPPEELAQLEGFEHIAFKNKGKSSKAYKNSIKRQIEKLQQQIEDDIESGELGLELVKKRPSINSEQRKEIEALLKPIEDAKKRIKGLKGDSRKIALEKLRDAEVELENKIFLGEIDESLLIKTKKGPQAYKLKNISTKPVLRKTLTDQQINEVSKQVLFTVLNENEEQMVGRIFRSVTEGGSNVLQTRTLLWNDSAAEKWLVDDVSVLGGLYMDQMTKRIHADKVFLKYGVDPEDGMVGMVKKLQDEYNIERDKILKHADSEQRRLDLNNLKKDLDKTEILMKNAYKVYMGNYVDNTTKAARISNGIKQFSAATLLGNVPILQLSEFFTPMFKFMFSEYVFDGLVPAIKRAIYIGKQKLKEYGGQNVEYIRGAFADAGLGVNMDNGARMQSLLGYGTQYQPKTLVERYVNNLAHLASQINFSNAISDSQEIVVSFTSQAKTIRTLERFRKGEKLFPEEIARLDLLRLNPEKWGNRILRQFEIFGEEVEGSFISNFYKWSDYEASQIFRIGLEKETRSVITKPNLLDIPFGFRDPLISMMTQFLSWTFASTLNFGLPVITSPDKQKFIGILLMLASGAMIDPLRQLARGEEPELDFDKLAISAMTNSGVFGWPFEALQKLNAGIDMPLLRPFQADRFKRKGAAAMIGGPFLGMADSMLSILSSLANGEMNHKDAVKASKFLAPMAFNWYLNKPMDTMIKSFGLPENRGQAKKLKEAE